MSYNVGDFIRVSTNLKIDPKNNMVESCNTLTKSMLKHNGKIRQIKHITNDKQYLIVGSNENWEEKMFTPVLMTFKELVQIYSDGFRGKIVSIDPSGCLCIEYTLEDGGIYDNYRAKFEINNKNINSFYKIIYEPVKLTFKEVLNLHDDVHVFTDELKYHPIEKEVTIGFLKTNLGYYPYNTIIKIINSTWYKKDS